MPSTPQELVELYPNLIVDQSETEVPFKLLKIDCDRWEQLEDVFAQLAALNDRLSLTGAQLTEYAKQWGIARDGLSDEELAQKVAIYRFRFFSGNTVHDFWSVLAAFGLADGAHIIQRTPPESAELSIYLPPGTTEETRLKIEEIARSVKAGGVQIEVYIGEASRILLQSGDALVQQSGDYLLLEQ
jgi:hypothetical protein